MNSTTVAIARCCSLICIRQKAPLPVVMQQSLAWDWGRGACSAFRRHDAALRV